LECDEKYRDILKLIEEESYNYQDNIEYSILQEQDNIEYSILQEQDKLFIFDDNAICVLSLLCKYLEKHEFICNNINQYTMIDNINLIHQSNFVRRFATLLIINFQSPEKRVFTVEEIVRFICEYINHIIHLSQLKYPNNDSIEVMLNSYPLTLISNISGLDFDNVFYLGEAVKRLIKIKKLTSFVLPDCLYLLSSNTINLENDLYPLNRNELDALFRYLDSRKSIYIDIFLHAAHDLNYHMKLCQGSASVDKLIEILESPWLYLYLFGALYSV
jgi:hypothetical protein